jgi:hypothetical protein
MDKIKVIETGEVVDLLHQGFDIVVIQFSNGTQKIVSPKDVGLTKRKRPKLWKQY